MLKDIDAMLQDWVKFHERLLRTSGIGYPSGSPVHAMTQVALIRSGRGTPDTRMVEFLYAVNERRVGPVIAARPIEHLRSTGTVPSHRVIS